MTTDPLNGPNTRRLVQILSRCAGFESRKGPYDGKGGKAANKGGKGWQQDEGYETEGSWYDGYNQGWSQWQSGGGVVAELCLVA